MNGLTPRIALGSALLAAFVTLVFVAVVDAFVGLDHAALLTPIEREPAVESLNGYPASRSELELQAALRR